MGVIFGEWLFPEGNAPTPDAVADALAVRTGLAVDRSRDADGSLEVVDFPIIKESLFDWQIDSDRVQVRSFIPAHPYLWGQLHAVMGSFGGQASDNPVAWRPDSPALALDRPWPELTRKQRFILRLPSILAWRPLDFLAQRDH